MELECPLWVGNGHKAAPVRVTVLGRELPFELVLLDGRFRPSRTLLRQGAYAENCRSDAQGITCSTPFVDVAGWP